MADRTSLWKQDHEMPPEIVMHVQSPAREEGHARPMLSVPPLPPVFLCTLLSPTASPSLSLPLPSLPAPSPIPPPLLHGRCFFHARAAQTGTCSLHARTAQPQLDIISRPARSQLDTLFIFPAFSNRPSLSLPLSLFCLLLSLSLHLFFTAGALHARTVQPQLDLISRPAQPQLDIL